MDSGVEGEFATGEDEQCGRGEDEWEEGEEEEEELVPDVARQDISAEQEYSFAMDASMYAPISYLLLGKTATEIALLTPHFATDAVVPGMEDELLTVALLPRKALGSKRGALAGPLLVRVAIEVECYYAEWDQMLMTTVDACLFSASLYDAIVNREDLDAGMKVAHTFNLATGGMISLKVHAACETAYLQVEAALQVLIRPALSSQTPKAAAAKRIAVPLAFSAKAKVAPGPALPLLGTTHIPKKQVPPKVAPMPKAGVAGVQTALAAQLQSHGIGGKELDLLLALAGPAPQGLRTAKTGVPKESVIEAVDYETTCAEETAAAAAAKAARHATIGGAMMKMAEILSELKPKKNQTGIDQAIGCLGSDASSSTTAQPSRRNAAARLALRKAVREQPEHFSSHIASAVLDSVAQIIPGIRESQASTGMVPFRAYLEHRAKLSSHRPTHWWLWQVAGIAEALSSGKTEEGYARTLLLLSAGEQLSIDSGSTVLAQELLWEDACPAITAKSIDRSSAQWPTIVDDRWAEIALGSVTDRLSWEKRKSEIVPKRAAGGGGYAGGDGDGDSTINRRRQPGRGEGEQKGAAGAPAA